jgi:type IV secretion system protein VirB10
MNLFMLRQPESDPDDENSVEGERALNSVNKGITLQNKITNWAVISAAVALAAIGLYKYYANVYHKYEKTKVAPKDLTRTVATTTLPPLTMPDLGPDKERETAVQPANLPPLVKPLPASTGAPVSSQPPARSLAELVRERRLKSEVRFNSTSRMSSASGAAVDLATTGTAAGGAAAAPTGQDKGVPSFGPASALGMQATNFNASRAYLLPEPSLMMTRGKMIPCTVLPAIDTTLSGAVTCVTTEDATSADNKVSLMDRATFCTGEQGGGVSRGQRRVGIIWKRCMTPQHVLVPLDSGAVDSIGRPGIPGQAEGHFWDRFGAAIALSLISDIGPYLVAMRQSGSNNTTVSFPTITGPQEVMSSVLKNSVDIPPTITAAQGARVTIHLTSDLDFRDVYQLERTK